MSVKFMLIKGEVEDSSRCMLLRQTAKATQAEKRLVENIRKLLEKTGLIVLTDEAFPVIFSMAETSSVPKEADLQKP